MKRRGSLSLVRHPAASPEWLSWCGVPVHISAATTHFLLVGITRSGKSVSGNLLLLGVLPWISEGANIRAFIYDHKNTMLPTLSVMGVQALVILVHPFDVRGWAWAIGRDFPNHADADELAYLLLRPEKATQPFFETAPAQLGGGVIRTLQRRMPETWTLRHLVLILSDQDLLRQALLRGPEENQRLLSAYFPSRKSRMGADVRATLFQKIMRLNIVAARMHHQAKAGRSFALADWMESESILVLGHASQYPEAMRGVTEALFRRMTQLLLAQPNRPQVQTWLYLDEILRAGQLAGLENSLTLGAEKRIVHVLTLQCLADLDKFYKDGTGKVLLSQCAHKAVLGLSDPETAQWAEKLFSSEEVLFRHPSTSFSRGGGPGGGTWSESTSEVWNRVVRPVVDAGYFLTLPSPEGDPRGRIHGVCRAPSLGGEAFPFELDLSQVARILPFPGPDDPQGFVPGDEDDNVLEPLSDEELSQLQLTRPSTAPSPVKTQKPRVVANPNNSKLDLQ